MPGSRLRASVRSGAVLVLAVVPALSGCGTQGASDVVAVEEQVRALGVEAAASGFAAQSAALADGHVSEAEYRQLYLDGMACWEREGMRVEPLRQTTTLYGHSYTYNWFDDDGRTPSMDCDSAYHGYANAAWNIQFGDVISPEVLPLAIECLDGTGVEAADVRTVTDLREFADAATLQSCLWDAVREVAGADGEAELSL